MRKEFTEEYYRDSPGYPSKRRMKKGPVAVIECVQEIPCNPCEQACPFKAISIGLPITNLPVLHEDACRGCGKCVAGCPGLAIFLLDADHDKKNATLTIPWEFIPLPEKGGSVTCLNREGKPVCRGTVTEVTDPEKNGKTALVTCMFPKKHSAEVRFLHRSRGMTHGSKKHTKKRGETR